MPFREETAMDQKVAFVVLARQGVMPFSRLCAKYGVSRACGYKWLLRYQQAGSVAALAEQSRRPHHSPTQTPRALVERVVALRRDHSWGARKLKVLLAQEGITLGEATINRVLAREGLVAPRQPRPAPRRFVRPECNQLWQMDFKGEYPLADGMCYPLGLLDDHSRYLMGLWPLADQQAATTQAVLEPLFREVGVPQAMLVDHGVPWWGSGNGFGLTRFAVWLMQQDIELIYAAVRHPQTSGKLERQNRTLKERTASVGRPESWSDWQDWVRYYRWEYNEIRPHEAVGLVPPAQVYTLANLRPYQERPREWEYGDACTARLNSAGCLYWRRRQYFVCEALAEQWVRLDELDGLLVVTFRRTTLREINLRTGETRPVALSQRFQ